MDLSVTSWSTLSVYLEEGDRFLFLNAYLKDRLKDDYGSGQIRNYFINFGDQRGYHISVFIESTGGISPSGLPHSIREFLRRSFSSKEKQSSPNLRHLFLDIPVTGILYNYVKLSPAPFLHFSGGPRRAYFDVLRGISQYVMEASCEDYKMMLGNKFSFCFNLVLYILSIIGSDKADCKAILGYLNASGLSQARARLDKDPEPQLLRSFDNNRHVLEGCFRDIWGSRDLSRHSYLRAIGEHAGGVRDPFSGGYTTIEENEHRPLFYSSLIDDIYNILDFDQRLACTYFLDKFFNTNNVYA